MVFSTSLFALIAVVAPGANYVKAHGFINDPKPTWKNKETSEWVVQIPPFWKGPWDEAKGDDGLLALFKELAPANNFKDLRSLFDGNPEFGEECGYTDPKGTPVDPPSNGAATLSRGIVHAGSCEIWLDDKLVLRNDDCQSAYGDGTQQTTTVFKPVDYSSCAAGGCLLRFYWLALQKLDGKTVWQAYKNCIPLTGPAGGGGAGTSKNTKSGAESEPLQKTYSDDDLTQTAGDTAEQSDIPSTGDPSSKKTDSDSQIKDKSKKEGESDYEKEDSSEKDGDSDSKKEDLSKKDGDSDSTKDDAAKKDGDSDSMKEDLSKKDDDSDPKESDLSKEDGDSDSNKSPQVGGDSDPMKLDTPSTGGSNTPPSYGNSDPPSSNPPPENPSSDTPDVTPAPAPSSKCTGRRRRF
ncbi:hypothetical protein CCR75_006004 [Bremia lactucae]|uniref:Uncharacterized protein n=1 Tax=Bremia lactucae TaxID=4779 RepID=A0A976FJ26_BRELC|nr:hypothetical protein CCR75_006004 [Bremia lactucae]